MNITKRDGTIVPFDKQKIINAIVKAFTEVDGKIYEYETAENIANEIEKQVHIIPNMAVEDIQDLVESCLMSSYRQDVARAYIRYRYKKEVARNICDDFLSAIEEKIQDTNTIDKAVLHDIIKHFLGEGE